jgi:Rha family phage regulatory protein
MQQAVPAVDLSSFVFASNDEIKTDTFKIAAKFSKRHDHVLRDVRKIIANLAELVSSNILQKDEIAAPNFGECFKNNELANGATTSFYEMNESAFMLVVMGYTGLNAMAIKMRYINAFNFMREKLTPKPSALRDIPVAYLTPAMKKHINRQVAFLAKTQVGTDYKVLGKSIQDKFNVNKRELIPASKYREVCAFLGCEPDAKALQGELLEPVKVEYQPPAGMVLVAVEELGRLRALPIHATSDELLKSEQRFTIQEIKAIFDECREHDLVIMPKQPFLEMKELLSKVI